MTRWNANDIEKTIGGDIKENQNIKNERMDVTHEKVVVPAPW